MLITDFSFGGCTFATASKPVATTVTLIVSTMFVSKEIPQITFASGSAEFVTIDAASSTSSREMSGEEIKDRITPRAWSIDVSSSGDSIALCAASLALFSPVA